jgi:hypothetical protein
MLIYSNLQLIRALVNFHVCIIKVSNLFVASVFMVYIFSLQMKDNIFKDQRLRKALIALAADSL